MPVWKLQCSIGADSALPRDRFVITPHFNDQGSLTSPQGLCEDLAEGLDLWIQQGAPGTPREVRVKAYDAQGTQPVLPQGEAVVNANAFPSSSIPRELSLCLSYYSEANQPRRRGRLYVPAAIQFGSTISAPRPTQANRDRVAALVPILTGLGGVDVDWVVFSRADNTPRPITHWWIDDEFDIQRRRGLRGTTRSLGSVSE